MLAGRVAAREIVISTALIDRELGDYRQTLLVGEVIVEAVDGAFDGNAGALFVTSRRVSFQRTSNSSRFAVDVPLSEVLDVTVLRCHRFLGGCSLELRLCSARDSPTGVRLRTLQRGMETQHLVTSVMAERERGMEWPASADPLRLVVDDGVADVVANMGGSLAVWSAPFRSSVFLETGAEAPDRYAMFEYPSVGFTAWVSEELRWVSGIRLARGKNGKVHARFSPAPTSE